MPHIPRILDEGSCYHIMSRGNNKRLIFYDEMDYEKFMEILRTYKKRTPFLLYHYALMPNHIHLQMQQAQPKWSLSEVLKRIKHAYSLYHKRRYGFVGHLWQGRFKHKLIETDAYMLQCGMYIELNPVRANIVTRPDSYRWSSAKSYVTGTIDPLIDYGSDFLSLGNNAAERIAAYRAALLVAATFGVPK